MIRTHSQKQLPLAEFGWPFQTDLDENNRWVQMSKCIPWDALAEGYYRGLESTQCRPGHWRGHHKAQALPLGSGDGCQL